MGGDRLSDVDILFNKQTSRPKGIQNIYDNEENNTCFNLFQKLNIVSFVFQNFRTARGRYLT